EALTEQVKEVVIAAEPTEPRLASRLEDSLRESNPDKISERMEESVEQLSGYGGQTFPNPREAQSLTDANTEDITKLKEGIEAAARSILGNETEALRIAQSELEELIQNLE